MLMTPSMRRYIVCSLHSWQKHPVSQTSSSSTPHKIVACDMMRYETSVQPVVHTCFAGVAASLRMVGRLLIPPEPDLHLLFLQIIRGIAMGLALIMYGREEEAETLIEQTTRDQDPILRYCSWPLPCSNVLQTMPTLTCTAPADTF